MLCNDRAYFSLSNYTQFTIRQSAGLQVGNTCTIMKACAKVIAHYKSIRPRKSNASFPVTRPTLNKDPASKKILFYFSHNAALNGHFSHVLDRECLFLLKLHSGALSLWPLQKRGGSDCAIFGTDSMAGSLKATLGIFYGRRVLR